ncbi:MAG: alkaline phosphatase family protein [Acidobacteria bacterium]|nr:alkaline phosphatase family protein [Acidobacteriota bacterium]
MHRIRSTRSIFALLLVTVLSSVVSAQGVKRLVMVKIDGLPGYSVDEFVHKKDPQTGKSLLPWFEEIFYKNGARLDNFYTRGISLSGPAWGMLDSGQHMQIKGNVEFDRYTLFAYDYLRFFSFYFDSLRQKRADMPAAEVMDQMRVPLFVDAFPYPTRYHSPQLYQRANNWIQLLGSSAAGLIPKDRGDLVDEWALGFQYLPMTVNQNEKEIHERIVSRPELDYFDYYDTSFDHIMHDNNDDKSRLVELQKIDRTLGKFWTAIQKSSRADETALVIVSDHGFNAKNGIYSQGFNLVNMMTSPEGGGHHVETKRRILLDYSLLGVNPMVPAIITPSKNSLYLKGQASQYPTALVDFDGNERSAMHLRERELNVLQMLLEELQQKKLALPVKTAAVNTIFKVIDDRRAYWQQTVAEMNEELAALQRWIDVEDRQVTAERKTLTIADKATGHDKEVARASALVGNAKQNEIEYKKYLSTLGNLLALQRDHFDAKKINIADLIAPGAMGRQNTLHQIQDYYVGIKPTGLVVGSDGLLDMDKSFVSVNYYDLLHDQSIRSNTQPGVKNRPIDFVAAHIPLANFAGTPLAETRANQDVIWLHGSEESQAFILSRVDDDGGMSYKYIPVSGLHQEADGKLRFRTRDIAPGFPLEYFEDPNLGIPVADRKAWFAEWHTEMEWLHAIHLTHYSNGLIGLNEQLIHHEVPDTFEPGISDDQRLIRRYRDRQRHLVEPDLLILANDHWNFDIRGFNPGGNHGSFFRVSTNSTFMIAGGAKTGIPRGLEITEPYDSLSLAPTLFRLMGKIDEKNVPDAELKNEGYHPFPGRTIIEITGDKVPQIVHN